MRDENYLKEVREHYENYPYPPTNPQDELVRFFLPMTEAFDRIGHFCFSGRRNLTSAFRPLVAGGGTGDAVIALAEQLRGTGQEVTYIDMSTASMNIAKERARIRGLTNIHWINDSLLNLPTLGLGTFDYINCSGVLHHLASPTEGLTALKSVLKEDGAMSIMVYATYGRTAVYQMQTALRLINRDEPNLQTRVDNAKAILNHLPSTNWFPASPPEIVNEINTDEGIYDLLLHAQDRSYTIPELYDFLSSADLQLVHLFPEHRSFGTRLYDPIFYVHPSLEPLVRAMPLRDQQALAEILNGKIFKHTFYAAPTQRPVPTLDLDMIPHFAIEMHRMGNDLVGLIDSATDVVAVRENDTLAQTMFPKSPHLSAIVKGIDGEKTLREIFRGVIDGYAGRKGAPNYPQLLAEFAPMYQALNNFYWMFLRSPGTARLHSYDELQGRVQKS